MPVGQCQHAIAELARRDNLELIPAPQYEWLSERGHLALGPLSRAVDALERIYKALGGDLDVLSTARARPLRSDLFHEPTGTHVEVDEDQHLTSWRSLTFSHYPEGIPLGFDVDAYREYCRRWSVKADRYRRNKSARGFGVAGRQRQRAYFDAVRDLAIGEKNGPPLIRVAAPEQDPVLAYSRVRAMLFVALNTQ